MPVVTEAHRGLCSSAVAAGADAVLLMLNGSLVDARETLGRLKPRSASEGGSDKKAPAAVAATQRALAELRKLHTLLHTKPAKPEGDDAVIGAAAARSRAAAPRGPAERCANGRGAHDDDRTQARPDTAADRAHGTVAEGPVFEGGSGLAPFGGDRTPAAAEAVERQAARGRHTRGVRRRDAIGSHGAASGGRVARGGQTRVGGAPGEARSRSARQSGRSQPETGDRSHAQRDAPRARRRQRSARARTCRVTNRRAKT